MSDSNVNAKDKRFKSVMVRLDKGVNKQEDTLLTSQSSVRFPINIDMDRSKCKNTFSVVLVKACLCWEHALTTHISLSKLWVSL